MDLSDLYLRASKAGGDAVERKVLYQRHWINSVTKFDPRTGEALPSGISSVLKNIDCMEISEEFRDHLWFIVDHCEDSIYRIFESMSDSPSRRHDYMHVSRVRELDVSSFVALSRRPGRNVREKLSSKPVMKAVRRVQSIDLPQNQLLKEVVLQLSDLLESRAVYLGYEDDLLDDLRRWLKSEDAKSIGGWRNLPPNNTLLSHPDYRRIWNSWNWLSNLQASLVKGLSDVEMNESVIEWWESLALRRRLGELSVAEVPVVVQIEDFNVSILVDWSEMRFGPSVVNEQPSTDHPLIRDPVCIDLTNTYPRYAIDEHAPVERFSEPLVWQSWSIDKRNVDLKLFEADAAYFHENCETYSIVDLFFKRRPAEEDITRAARTFVERLSLRFRHQTLIWLVPDCVNEFQLGILRRSLNSKFSRAQPLPRSVASVFKHVAYEEIPGSGFEVVVVDRAGGLTFVTRLIAEHDSDLEEQLPETRGFYWVRTPHIEIRNDDNGYQQITEFDFVDDDGNWVTKLGIAEEPIADINAIARLIGKECRVINVASDSVEGGLRFLRLQELAGDIPLWRDQIPRLALTGVVIDGLVSSLVLVPESYRVRLVRGKPVSIPVEADLDLPEKVLSCRFGIVQGSAGNEIDFDAFLESDDFPLQTSPRVSLDLTYTYGADDPYRLVFKPSDATKDGRFLMKPAVVRWMPKSPRDLNSLPVPPFPEKKSWEALREWPSDKQSREQRESDLLDRTMIQLKKLTDSSISELLTPRVKGKVKFWRHDKNGKIYFIVTTNQGREVFCHESNVPDGIPKSISEGDFVWLNIEKSEKGGLQGNYVAFSKESFKSAWEKTVFKTFGNMKFPSYTIWNHGRSLTDIECPENFREIVYWGIKYSFSLYMDKETPARIRTEALLFLSRLHGDAPIEIQQYLAEISKFEIGYADAIAIAYFIGGCSTNWQEVTLLNVLNGNASRRFLVLSIALWRSPKPINFVSLVHLKEIIPVLHKDIERLLEKTDQERSRKQLVSQFEVLLALLRTRESGSVEAKSFLSPDSKYGVKFLKQIDQSIDVFVKHKYELFTRVSLEVSKPEFAQKQPDLLYALRLFLTGDDQAKMIRISGISQGDDKDWR